MRSTSLPTTPLGRYGGHGWTALQTDEERAPDSAPPPRFAASSPPSPLGALVSQAARHRKVFRPLLYERVDLLIEAEEGGGEEEDAAGGSSSAATHLDAAERLLMLLSLPEGAASVYEVMAAAAGCYSARLSEHAKEGGDSSEFVASLPAAAHAALTAFISRPSVQAQLHREEHRALLSLVEAQQEQQVQATQATEEKAAPPPAALLVPSDEEEVAGEEEEEEEELLTGPLNETMAAVSTNEHAGDDDDDDDEAEYGAAVKPPSWAGHSRLAAARSAACATPTELLATDELGWTVVESQDEQPSPPQLLSPRRSPGAHKAGLIRYGENYKSRTSPPNARLSPKMAQVHTPPGRRPVGSMTAVHADAAVPSDAGRALSAMLAPSGCASCPSPAAGASAAGEASGWDPSAVSQLELPDSSDDEAADGLWPGMPKPESAGRSGRPPSGPSSCTSCGSASEPGGALPPWLER